MNIHKRVTNALTYSEFTKIQSSIHIQLTNLYRLSASIKYKIPTRNTKTTFKILDLFLLHDFGRVVIIVLISWIPLMNFHNQSLGPNNWMRGRYCSLIVVVGCMPFNILPCESTWIITLSSKLHGSELLERLCRIPKNWLIHSPRGIFEQCSNWIARQLNIYLVRLAREPMLEIMLWVIYK